MSLGIRLGRFDRSSLRCSIQAIRERLRTGARPREQQARDELTEKTRHAAE